MPEFLSELSLKVVLGLILPIYDALFSGSVRFFWLYFLAGLVMAAIWHRRQKQTDPFYARLLDVQIWTSPSARNDYFVLLINSVFRILLLSALLSHLNVIASWTTEFLRFVGVRGTQTGTNSLLAGLALTLTLFIARDATRFYMHYMMHKIPALWEFHKVHHSAEVLNFFTAERFHPVEVLISSTLMVTVTALVNGIFIALFGDHLTPLTVAGANAFWVLGNVFFGGILRHSPYPISFGPVLERWFISPAMHHIHHSDKPEHFDRNMGGTLTIWDRMAGTHLIAAGQKVEGFGIGEETPAFRSLSEIYFRPFISLYQRLGSPDQLASKGH